MATSPSPTPTSASPDVSLVTSLARILRQALRSSSNGTYLTTAMAGPTPAKTCKIFIFIIIIFFLFSGFIFVFLVLFFSPYLRGEKKILKFFFFVEDGRVGFF